MDSLKATPIGRPNLQKPINNTMLTATHKRTKNKYFAGEVFHLTNYRSIPRKMREMAPSEITFEIFRSGVGGDPKRCNEKT